ncbi:uncharacterized protein SPAPADRAFT_58526 [Spathaspora passalidarum NRRL Y-27907]|uniref:Uncharacterized protein n=1 Tax=Spathaspora passalidarum (strain NRRL Y-27907 / 11-Y1) TaxID=619300 RepID=G3AGG6_SPAPN|nr:uncharacterized protein SPAPADRAFT_58526 [Spathaspora passalidarum NRRL Y-27907]EGW35305.1 hypothetical protein SPAPADRAFT_58526 [Spathaspora passalidarum NRRL Y-27907]
MKFSSLITAIPIFGMVMGHTIDYDSQLQEILTPPQFEKRASNNSLVPLLQTLAGSGLIPNLLSEITSSQQKMDTVADLILSAVQGGSSIFSNISLNLNMNVSTTELLSGITGLLPSVFQGLLVNETNRNVIAGVASGLLGSKEYVWISALILELGQGADLTVDLLANLMINGTTYMKFSDYGKIEEVNEVEKRDTDDNDGSFSQLLNNMVGTLLNSNLFKGTAQQLFDAIEESGIVVPLVLDIITIPTLPKFAGVVLKKLYDNHVFDGIDLNSYYVAIKKSNLLTDSTEALLTDETFGPAVALLLKRIEDLGTFDAITRNMYGDLAKIPSESAKSSDAAAEPTY